METTDLDQLIKEEYQGWKPRVPDDGELKKLLKDLEKEVADLPPDGVNRRVGQAFEFVNPSNIEEGRRVLDNAISKDPSLLAQAREVELLAVYDAAAKPMNRSAGEPNATPGAYSKKALVGTSGAIMLWGPYAALEAVAD